MIAILNPEPGRAICRGPAAHRIAASMAKIERDNGRKVVVLDGADFLPEPRGPQARIRQAQILSADIIIDVIP